MVWERYVKTQKIWDKVVAHTLSKVKLLSLPQSLASVTMAGMLATALQASGPLTGIIPQCNFWGQRWERFLRWWGGPPEHHLSLSAPSHSGTRACSPLGVPPHHPGPQVLLQLVTKKGRKEKEERKRVIRKRNIRKRTGCGIHSQNGACPRCVIKRWDLQIVNKFSFSI